MGFREAGCGFILTCLLGFRLSAMCHSLGKKFKELRSVSSAFSRLVKNPLFPHCLRMPFATALGHCPWSEGVIPKHLLLPEASLHGPGSQEPLLSGYSPHEESHHVCSYHRQNGVTKSNSCSHYRAHGILGLPPQQRQFP